MRAVQALLLCTLAVGSTAGCGDIDGGTARIGTTHTTALLTQNSVHFMERTMAGSLTMVTVLAQKSPKGTLRAVRSRHDYLQMAIPGFVAEPNVSQHYGECEPTD